VAHDESSSAGASGIPEPAAEESGNRRKIGAGKDGKVVRQKPFRLGYEDARLSEQITSWVENTFPGDDVKRTFVEAELRSRLESYARQARSWRAAQILIWLLIVLLGLLISVFAAFKSNHGFTIVAGALIATLTTLANATHPARQADAFTTAGLALRDEGWHLLNHMDDYAQLADLARYEHFAEAIHTIVQTKRRSANLDGLAP
jgi:hypothetical protein